ncbi:MAG: hypothetical protein ABI707_15680, partial [Ferruginibacter sp.]
SCHKEKSIPLKDVTVIQATGSIQNKMDEFRHLLGDQLNTTTGLTVGRREINWDGVPDSLVGKDLPLDFFNPSSPGAPQARQRGLTYAAAGHFQVSSNNFRDVNSNAAGQFQAFSGDKVFANISSNAWEIEVQKAGENIAASTRGFGVVFSDVDLPNSTSLEFFNGDKSIGKYFVPPHDAGSSFSFLGVYFNGAERITHIRVQHDGVLADGQKDISDKGPSDLVVLDDFLYSEPVVN